jgi:murein DD-endopeptidase MepM/ murein hydrolase activator NlpD
MSPRHSRKTLPRAKAPHQGSLRLLAVLAVLVGINLYVFLWRADTSIPAVMEQAALAGAEGDRQTDRQTDRQNRQTGEPSGDDSDDDDDSPGDDSDKGDDGDGDVLPPPTDDSDSDGAGGDGSRWVDGEVQRGDSLGKLLSRNNLTPPEASEVLRALQPHMDFRKIRPGQRYRIQFDADNRVIGFEFHISRTLVIRAERDDSGELVGRADKAATETKTGAVGGRIDSSLYQAIKDSGEDTGLVAFFVDVFAYDLNFYIDTHKGDSFRMLVEKEFLDGDFLRYGRVLAAEYSGKAGTFQAYYFTPPGSKSGRYYDAKGRSVERSLLKTPLKYARISSKFNPKRMHPVLHVRRGHFGVDYAAPTGTPVWAAASGKIAFRGRRGGAGNCVIVKHDNGLETIYMHLSKFRKGQKVGQRVKGKTVIGYVGTTGLSTGPHLHFSVKKGGRYVDPLKLKPSRGRSVPKKHRSAFNTRVAALAGKLERIAVPEAKL